MILSDGTHSITLPDDIFEWSDELGWEQIRQAQELTLTGALVVDQFVQSGGRPITITPKPNGGWLTREQWALVDGWRHTPGKTLTLAMDGEPEKTVIFGRPAMEAAPVKGFTNRRDEEFWRGTIRLLEA